MKIEDILTELTASPPRVYNQLQEAVKDPLNSFDHFGQIIVSDTALSARLLKIVNSSFYNFATKIETISHGLSIVGLEQLMDLALATVVMDKFKGIPKDLVLMDSFWRHSIGCGLLSRILAKHLGETITERHYVAGILHDVGSLVIFQEIPVKARLILDQAKNEKTDLMDVERQVLGFAHGEVGSVLFEKWNLPQIFIDVARHHNSPLEDSRNRRFETIIHVADHWTHRWEIGNSGEPHPPTLRAGALEFLDIEEKQMDGFKDELLEQFNDTLEFLN